MIMVLAHFLAIILAAGSATAYLVAAPGTPVLSLSRIVLGK